MKTRKIVFSIGLIILILVVSSCSFSVEGVKDLFPSRTPTSTATPTATATSTATPTATSTPLAPFTLKPCVFLEECPDALPLEEIMGSSIEFDVVNNVSIPYTQAAQLMVGWFAIDESTLADNLEHIQWFFTVDGQDYFNDKWLEGGGTPDDDNPSILYPGQWFGVEMSGWKVDEPHFIRLGYVVDAPISNGWEEYAAGYTYLMSWYVKPANLPTATPEPTLTRTPTITPTPLPRPTSTKGLLPTYTTGPALTLDITLRVDNKCGESHTVVFNGPMRLKYTVPANSKLEYQAAHGTYTWLVDNTWQGGPQDLNVSVWVLTLCQ